jgi:hypothetical protein
MIGSLYLVVPEMFRSKDVLKFGRSCNIEKRFREFGDLEIIKVCKVKNLIEAE